MSIPRSSVPVNTPLVFANEQHADADQRQVDRAERLAMTIADLVRAASNRHQVEYWRYDVHIGGVGWIDSLQPKEYPQAGPWYYLLPIGTRTVNGKERRTYLIRAQKPNFSSPDWIESERMHEHVQDANAAEWLAEYQQYIAENGIGDPDNLEDMS